MREGAVVCTFKRPELLYCCLKRIKEADPLMPIAVFPDRGTWRDEAVQSIARTFNAYVFPVPEHHYHGNSYNAGEALRRVQSDFDLIHYCEDDTLIAPDLFSWAREKHEDFPNIFCSAGWVFNLCAPIDSGDYFAPWLYIPQFSIRDNKLALVTQHLGPLYYEDMQAFVGRTFTDSCLSTLDPATWHYEIDGLMQRVLMRDGSQVAWPSVAKVTHLGFAGYNRGGYEAYEEYFKDAPDFVERVKRVEELAADHYARMETFGRPIVERELGRVIPKRQFTYKVTQPGGWEAVFRSELKREFLPKRLLSVPVTKDTEIVLG